MLIDLMVYDDLFGWVGLLLVLNLICLFEVVYLEWLLQWFMSASGF